MKLLITAFLAAASTVSLAQSSVGKLERVEGIVSVSYNGSMNTVTGSATLNNGTVFVSAATGSV